MLAKVSKQATKEEQVKAKFRTPYSEISAPNQNILVIIKN